MNDNVDVIEPIDSVEIPLEERQTTPYLTKYERARILGARALQLSMNAPAMINVKPGVTDPLEIAEMELAAKPPKIPMIIRRYLPDRSYEDWKLSELNID
ncbi:RNA polymerase, subunit omega/K/RPB6 [Carpediemonas membranifera]|uniref:RNA polymerase, subunit omega/K/RPB6 n=1 Tax=Carpediemonas membranifera TaxID=201153 RepID=A0A8J6E0W8_9EUKA|nr:RNA polymerase, subunit omega/K/RPB6 [Carpediemonas membranifera]|eukprot:KAG9395619.1 RNA polymerase, subunit omega/K/RPB6 [Carpediemonas membranifera]